MQAAALRLGAGHTNYVSAYNYLDVRGSYTITNYKRASASSLRPACSTGAGISLC